MALSETTASSLAHPSHSDLSALLKRHWGYESFLTDQATAIDAVMARRDALVVLPTGGGKSMCYQLPALALPGTAVVVSPLISLMKDQVDALTANGVATAALNSFLSLAERDKVAADLRSGRLKLLYVSPEGLATPRVLELLDEIEISFFAVDEAHCVSQWGHEYRPDYRNLGRLRALCPAAALHAFTATATEAVRTDIIESLGMRDAVCVVGSFDRPNLTYRTEYRKDLLRQVRAVLDRHPGEAGIIYCIKRADVDALAETLKHLGIRALPYHAGMSPEERRRNQDAFSNEQVDIIVATVAFGMGIDRSDVRFVIHTGLPKAVENYQQEAGRAGRDRLDAECVLFYGAGDVITWRSIMGAPQSGYDEAALARVNEMYRFCRTFTCRHRFLVQYFGQEHSGESCGACDVCLGEVEALNDSLVTAQKILSCVARVLERFGARYVAEVLKGSAGARILQNGHERLSTYGLLAEYAINDIVDWIDQLAGQGYLVRMGEYNVVQLTAEGRALLRGEGYPQLTRPRHAEPRVARRRSADREELTTAEEALFQDLRAMRLALARERGVPPYIIFTDATLLELARRRPATLVALLRVKGMGESKARAFGDHVLATLRECGEARGLVPAPQEWRTATAPGRTNGHRQAACEAFRSGRSVAEVAAQTGRAVSTVEGYLLEYIQEAGVTLVEPWLDRATYEQVCATAACLQAERLKPIFEALDGAVPYSQIRVALAIRANSSR